MLSGVFDAAVIVHGCAVINHQPVSSDRGSRVSMESDLSNNYYRAIFSQRQQRRRASFDRLRMSGRTGFHILKAGF